MIQMPCTNFWANRNGMHARWLIVHGTAGGSSAQGVANDFIHSQGSSSPKSTHYIIGQDGTVVQCVQEKDAAWGNGIPEHGCDVWWDTGINPNLTTISIEHVKNDTTNGIALTDAQRNASFNLIKDICARNNIPMHKADSNGGITGHFSISPLSRARCPGTYPWMELFNFLGNPSTQGATDMPLQITDPFAAAYFKESDPNHWFCPNTNQTIADGILGFYRTIQAAPRLPLSGEQYDIPGVAYQIFESGVIVYDPQGKIDGGGVYLLKNDSDLARKLVGITYLKNQIIDLQVKITNAAQPVDKAGVQAALVAAQASIQVALGKVA